ncbi:hypothetical protein B484DRAFT_429032 [Ochromonadaceae sp. CCMP2298]|nr:hypothetical protein B484DRAFT_429032 [Ochromonadaceae sp. CCMP2298]
MLNDDDFGEGSGDEMDQASYRKLKDKLSKDGFRIGKAKEEEVITQVGFDEGFIDGIRIGKAAGRFYGAARLFASSHGDVQKLEKLLFEDMPESLQPIEFVDEIEQTVRSISLTLAEDFAIFKAAMEGVPTEATAVDLNAAGRC